MSMTAIEIVQTLVMGLIKMIAFIMGIAFIGLISTGPMGIAVHIKNQIENKSSGNGYSFIAIAGIWVVATGIVMFSLYSTRTVGNPNVEAPYVAAVFLTLLTMFVGVLILISVKKRHIQKMLYVIYNPQTVVSTLINKVFGRVIDDFKEARKLI